MMQAPALNGVREPYLEAVRQDPGISTAEVARRLGVDDSTAAYHLRRLARAGIIVSEPAARHVAHFAVGSVTPRERLLGHASRTGRAAYAVLRGESRPLSAPEVAERMGVNVGAVRYAMDQLVLLGLARKTTRGKCEVI